MTGEYVDLRCHRCGTQVQPSQLTGERLFYDIEVLSEKHLCADCVLDLMHTDPTCEDVMQYVVMVGGWPARYPFDEEVTP